MYDYKILKEETVYSSTLEEKINKLSKKGYQIVEGIKIAKWVEEKKDYLVVLMEKRIDKNQM